MSSRYTSNLKAHSFRSLKRVIVSYNNNIAMKETLAQSLAAVFGASDQIQADLNTVIEAEAANTVVSGQEGVSSEALDEMAWSELAVRARQQLSLAEAQQRGGDWSGYGQSLKDLADTLQRLEQMATGQPLSPDALEENGVPEPSAEDAQ